MTLAELRRAAVKNQYSVRFPLRNGMECVVTDRGIAQLPGLRQVPDFNLEEELAAAQQFVMEKGIDRKSVSRDQMERWATPSTGPVPHDDHDE